VCKQKRDVHRERSRWRQRSLLATKHSHGATGIAYGGKARDIRYSFLSPPCVKRNKRADRSKQHALPSQERIRVHSYSGGRVWTISQRCAFNADTKSRPHMYGGHHTYTCTGSGTTQLERPSEAEQIEMSLAARALLSFPLLQRKQETA